MNIATSAGAHWTRRASVVDWLIAAASVGLAAVSVYALSVPVPTFGDVRELILLWPIAGVAWAVLLLLGSKDGGSRFAAALLILVAGLSFLAFFAYIFSGPFVLAAGVVISLALLAVVVVRERERKLVWLIAPAAVLLMALVVVSGISTSVRFRLGEPALRSLVEAIESSGSDSMHANVRATVGSFDIVSADLAGGCVHLTMGYTGFLDEQPTGVAHCPGGPPPVEGGSIATFTYEPFQGVWYRWLSSSEFPFD